MNELTTRLMKNCSEFLTSRKDLLNNELQMIELTEKLTAIELSARKGVLNAVDDNGKALYSNEEKRALAVKESLSTDSEHARLTQEQKELTGAGMRLKATLEMLKYEKSVLQSVLAVSNDNN